MSKITDFLKGVGQDHRGRKAEDYMSFGELDLEKSHDFIQWMFPSDIPSQSFKEAPVLSESDIMALKSDEEIQSTLSVFFSIMFSFYMGSEHWITRKNHNYLRITRILRCLSLAGMHDERNEFMQFLKEIYSKNQKLIGDETWNFWTNSDNLTIDYVKVHGD